MVRVLISFVSLLALLTAPGCVALDSPESWSASCRPDSAPSFATPCPPATQEALLPSDQRQVWITPPPFEEVLPEYTPHSPAESADSVPLAASSPSGDPTPSTTVRLYYGTNRTTPQATTLPATNHYGQCEVSIPKRHQFGQLERPSFWRLEFRESDAKHVVLQQVEPLNPEVCLGRLREDLTTKEESALFVFVHGYNVDFAEAAQRTAQMAFDLQFRGVPLFYSWPSHGTLRGYAGDQRSADASAGPLAEFLTRVATETGARQIHLVAHSLGNRALVGALAQLGESAEGNVRFNQVVFAAPDLDAAQFAHDLAPRIRPVVDRVTIYESGSDLALWASRMWHRTVRLGQPGPYWTQIRTYDWIDVIDATAVGFEWFELGHSAYGGELLADVQRVLECRPVGDTVAGPGSGRWTVTRPRPSLAPSGPLYGSTPPPVYLYRPVGPWPAAPVDRWR
jgi:esterase/lipase superfamily enzyme